MQRVIFLLSLSPSQSKPNSYTGLNSSGVAYFHINNLIFYMSISLSTSFFSLTLLHFFLYHSAHPPSLIISVLHPSQFSISFSHFFDHFVYSSLSALILLLFPESGGIRCSSSLVLGETLHSSLF